MAGRAYVVVFYDDGSKSGWNIPDDEEHMRPVMEVLYANADVYSIKDSEGYEVDALGRYGI